MPEYNTLLIHKLLLIGVGMPEELFDPYVICEKFKRLIGDPVHAQLVRPNSPEIATSMASDIAIILNANASRVADFQLIEGMFSLADVLMKRTPTPADVLGKAFSKAKRSEHRDDPLRCEKSLVEYFGMELARSAVTSGAAICLAEDEGYFSAVGVDHFDSRSVVPSYSLPYENEEINAHDFAQMYINEIGADRLYFVLFERLCEVYKPKSDQGAALGAEAGSRLASPNPNSELYTKGFAKLDAPHVARGIEMLSADKVSSAQAAANVVGAELWKDRHASGDPHWPGASEDAIVDRIGRRIRETISKDDEQS